MKYVMVVGDGMADLPVAELGGRTPLETAAGESMARVAGGELGVARTCPEGLPPGSDVAFLSLMGCDPLAVYTGRSPLEAAGEGVALEDGEVSLRVNLITVEDGRLTSYNGRGIDGSPARALVERLLADEKFGALMTEAGMRIVPTDSFRHVAVLKDEGGEFELAPAHDIAGQFISAHAPRGARAKELAALQARALEVLSPLGASANGIWFWGAGRRAKLPNFAARWGLEGIAVSAVPLVRGIAWLSGLEAPRVPGATGELETNYAGKVACALEGLKRRDFALVHLEAPDDMSHTGDAQGKCEAIRRLDARLIAPLMRALDDASEPYRLLLIPDHYTLLSTRTHDGRPTPYAIYDSRRTGAPKLFSEKTCAGGGNFAESGAALLERFFESRGKR